MDRRAEPSNQQLLDRIVQLEGKMDRMTVMMEQASGAWFFIKIVSSLLIGVSILWSNMHSGWFK